MALARLETFAIEALRQAGIRVGTPTRPCRVVSGVTRSGRGMKWRVMVELIGGDGTVCTHEIGSGGSNTAECSAATAGLTLVPCSRFLPYVFARARAFRPLDASRLHPWAVAALR